jgi:hypothetical protein
MNFSFSEMNNQGTINTQQQTQFTYENNQIESIPGIAAQFPDNVIDLIQIKQPHTNQTLIGQKRSSDHFNEQLTSVNVVQEDSLNNEPLLNNQSALFYKAQASLNDLNELEDTGKHVQSSLL